MKDNCAAHCSCVHATATTTRMTTANELQQLAMCRSQNKHSQARQRPTFTYICTYPHLHMNVCVFCLNCCEIAIVNCCFVAVFWVRVARFLLISDCIAYAGQATHPPHKHINTHSLKHTHIHIDTLMLQRRLQISQNCLLYAFNACSYSYAMCYNLICSRFYCIFSAFSTSSHFNMFVYYFNHCFCF